MWQEMGEKEAEFGGILAKRGKGGSNGMLLITTRCRQKVALGVQATTKLWPRAGITTCGSSALHDCPPFRLPIFTVRRETPPVCYSFLGAN